MKTLEEMKARLLEITNSLSDFNAKPDFSPEDVEEINALSEEFENLKTQVEAKEKVATMVAASKSSTRKTTTESSEGRVEVKATRAEKTQGFNTFGEFLNSVKKASSGEMDKRFSNNMSTTVDADGGFLVPADFLTDVTKRLASDESLLSKTRQFTVSGNNLTLPKDESQPWSGGVEAYWVNEGAVITSSKPTLTQADFKLKKLGALIKITDELIDDSVALESYIRGMAPEAIMHKINNAIISGDGVGKPFGILGSSFKISVAPEAGQAADTIVTKNIIKMYSKMIPSARANSAWYVNAMCEEQLRTLKDENGNYIYLAAGSSLNNTPHALLLGRPVIYMLGSLSELGTEGDILFGDLSYYYSIIKTNGMKQAVSTHLFFDREISAFRFTMRVDGKCPFNTPVVTQNGNYSMSAFISLADRTGV